MADCLEKNDKIALIYENSDLKQLEKAGYRKQAFITTKIRVRDVMSSDHVRSSEFQQDKNLTDANKLKSGYMTSLNSEN